MDRDEDIRIRLMEELYWDDRLKGIEIGIRVENSIVTLDGIVPSVAHKSVVVSDARAIPDISKLVDKVKVAHSGTYEAGNDLNIQENLLLMLAENEDLDASKIEIDVKDGVVTLKGTVDLLHRKRVIENISWKVLGVRDVVNDIAVVPSLMPGDEHIGRLVEDRLEKAEGIRAEAIEIKVQDGVVTVSGAVMNEEEYGRIISAVSDVGGVTKVVDHLVIG
jgi:osmotically-inducible protein OsmY